MNKYRTHLPKVPSASLKTYPDKRGEVYPSWKKEWFGLDFVEDRFSRSTKGVIRGFHGDSTTWKLCFCVFGKLELVTWSIKDQTKQVFILDCQEKQQVLVPPDFLNAHQCLSNECILHYKWTHPYSGQENQWSIYYNDPTINHKWSLQPTIVSERDLAAPKLQEVILC